MSPMMFRWLVWADVGRGQWEIQGSSRTPKGAEKIEARIRRKYKNKVTTRIEDRENPVLQPDRLKRSKRKKKGQRGKSPPRLGGKWKNRKRPLGFRAREILRRVRSKRKKVEVQTALELVKDRQMDQQTFINLIQSLGFTGQEAYTFWFSPP